MARLNLRDSVRLLEHAYEEGITYFDVARSYGYGAAERAVGTFAQGKRDHITIATKLGILPPKRSAVLSVAKKAAGFLVRLRPSLRDRLRAQAGSMVVRGSFRVDQARASFETSLRELKVDRVDALLLHQCDPKNLEDGELRELLQTWLDRGRVGRIGIATHPSTIEWALREQSDADRVYQFPNTLLRPFRTPLLVGRKVVTHSTLREDLPRIMERLQTDRQFARRWSEDLDLPTQKEEVAAMLLSWALRQYDGGTVLFSTSRAGTIGKNVRRSLALAEYPQRSIALERLVGAAINPLTASA